jgi:hypothetical protein
MEMHRLCQFSKALVPHIVAAYFAAASSPPLQHVVKWLSELTEVQTDVQQSSNRHVA